MNNKIELKELKDLMINNKDHLETRISKYLKKHYDSAYLTSYYDDIEHDVVVTKVLDCSIDMNTLTLIGENKASFECSVLVNVMFVPSQLGEDYKYHYFDEEDDDNFEEGETYFNETMNIEVKFDDANKPLYRLHRKDGIKVY